MRFDVPSAPASRLRAHDGANDDIATVIAISLIAYASADIAHHVLGHGGACLALGGRIVSLSSIFVNCTVRGTVVDLAGPFANLGVGLAGLFGAMHVRVRSTSPSAHLFLALVAGFNLLWFMMQLVFSVATLTDDFAWAMHEFRIGVPTRVGLIVLGSFGYILAMRLIAISMAAFALPRKRLAWLMRICWLSAGIFACVTAMYDPDPLPAILHHAAPQSFILAIGLLLVAAITPSSSSVAAPSIRFSARWIAAAVAILSASIVFLGPGFSIAA
jgi:hypothetical protein